MDKKQQELLEQLKKFKTSSRYLKWKRFSSACEHMMKLHPGTYKMHYSVTGSMDFAEITGMPKSMDNKYSIREYKDYLGTCYFSEEVSD